MNKDKIGINTLVSMVETDKNYPIFPYNQDSGQLYESTLDLLEGLGLKRNNPFSHYVKPGEVALIKPNWVREANPLGYDIESLLTHSSLIKYLIDLLALAMKGKGTIVIADAPLQKCDFEKLKSLTRIGEVVDRARRNYPNIEIIIEDWRITTLKHYASDEKSLQEYRLDASGLSDRYQIIDLARESFLEEISEYSDRFRVTNYKPSLMRLHHSKGKHEYLVSKRVFEADFIINLSKMKTHMKAGLTCALKNLIGINGHKEFLPHHIKGSYFEGGDNYLMPNRLRAKYEDLYDYIWEDINRFSIRQRRFLLKILRYLWIASVKFGKENISAGSWRGNDTVWRTTLDLNHIAYFHISKPRKILNIIDGVIAGEGHGPLKPTPRPIGILIAGENPAYTDAVAAKIMGYIPARIPTIYNAVYNKKSKFSAEILEDFKVIVRNNGLSKAISFDEIMNLNFKKPPYWGGA
jgi:uncharacterized protein (DUF362 family)